MLKSDFANSFPICEQSSQETQLATSSVYATLEFHGSKTKGMTFHCVHMCLLCAFPALLVFITVS